MSEAGDVLRQIRSDDWFVRRHGIVEEVIVVGGALRFRVTVWDDGRAPFLVQWFNDVAPAVDFLEKLVNDGAGRRQMEVKD